MNGARAPLAPAGLTIGRGAYILSERLYGGPGWSIHRGSSRWSGGSVLVTIARHRTLSHHELFARLALPHRDLAALLHVGTVDDGQQGGLVEEEPRGTPLAAAALPLGPAAVALMVRQIASVLEVVHGSGVVLGGLQPELIYARPAPGGPLLTGIVPRSRIFVREAGLTEAGGFGHSYAPPLAEPAADVFSLCALAAHWLSGFHPFRGLRPGAQLLAIARGERRSLSAPSGWREILERGLRRDGGLELAELVAALDAVD
jgi:hypothetical protein